MNFDDMRALLWNHSMSEADLQASMESMVSWKYFPEKEEGNPPVRGSPTPKRIVHSGSKWQPQLVELIIAIVHVDVVLLSIRLLEYRFTGWCLWGAPRTECCPSRSGPPRPNPNKANVRGGDQLQADGWSSLQVS